MKVLFIGGRQYPLDIMKPDDICSCATLYSYFLRHAMEKAGVETAICNAGACELSGEASRKYYQKLRIPKADHALAVEQRAFANRDEHFCNAIRAKVSGKITTMCDKADRTGPEDMTFYAAPVNRPKPKTKFVGWATSPSYCYPQQRQDELRIFIDHAYYGGACNEDRTEDILDSLRLIPDTGDRKVVVTQYLTGTLSELADHKHPCRGHEFKRGPTLPWPELMAEFRRTHVFCVTHGESMGLCVLEAAACGALIAAPAGTIRPKLLRPLRHVEYPEKPPWDEILHDVNPMLCGGAAEKFYRWDEIAKIILSYMEN